MGGITNKNGRDGSFIISSSVPEWVNPCGGCGRRRRGAEGGGGWRLSLGVRRRPAAGDGS